MSDGGIVTTEVNGFTVTSNTAKSESQLRTNLKGEAEKSVSKAASELGKRGAEASAKARAERPEKEGPAPEEKPEKVEAKAEPEPEEKVEAKAEPEGEEKAPEKDKRGDPRHDPRARMLEATRKEAEAKRELAREREEKRALSARIEALERGERPQPKPEPEKSNGKPTPNDYESYEEYLDARDKYNYNQWESENKRKAQESAVQNAFDDQIGKFSKAAKQHLDKYSDEVLTLKTEFQLEPGERPTGANWLANELVFSPETAPSLMLHFSEHPDELQRIATLTTPRAVSREMAKIEARLESAKTGDTSERDEDVSRAAPPVRPVTGKPYVNDSDEYRPGMGLDQYKKVWEKQVLKRNR